MDGVGPVVGPVGISPSASTLPSTQAAARFSLAMEGLVTWNLGHVLVETSASLLGTRASLLGARASLLGARALLLVTIS